VTSLYIKNSWRNKLRLAEGEWFQLMLQYLPNICISEFIATVVGDLCSAQRDRRLLLPALIEKKLKKTLSP
jgi:hypothetical protein